MKIVDVKTYPVVYPVKDPFANAMRWTRERPFGIVEVITDSGIQAQKASSNMQFPIVATILPVMALILIPTALQLTTLN